MKNELKGLRSSNQYTNDNIFVFVKYTSNSFNINQEMSVSLSFEEEKIKKIKKEEEKLSNFCKRLFCFKRLFGNVIQQLFA